MRASALAVGQAGPVVAAQVVGQAAVAVIKVAPAVAADVGAVVAVMP